MDTPRFDEGSSSLSVRTSFECFQLCLHPAIAIIISWYSSSYVECWCEPDPYSFFFVPLAVSLSLCWQYKQKTHLLRLLNPSAHNDARAVKDNFVDKFMAGTS